ncbi:MAG: TetR/AcrR family transcriptional regulator [Anaerolineae bacterium]|nr:TetR/AcrR family transcriptional regulator [Anaerolineae bacterium]
MQILKPEIRQSILENAENMFFMQGFLGASTRELAQKVGISYSNLYRYFDNKNDLFEAVVDSYYTHFLIKLNRFLEHEEQNQNGGHSRALVETFINLIQLDRQKFIILLEGSRGTRYEQLRLEMVERIEERIQFSLPKNHLVDKTVTHILAAHFLDGIIEIARSVSDAGLQRTRLETLVVYHLAGVEALAKG